MILKTKEFQEVCKVITLAVDGKSANLELKTRDNYLYLSVTNREYYTSIKFELEASIEFRAVVEAPLFLNLISGITSDTFELNIVNNSISVKAGKSSYKLAMIYENDKLMELPVITIGNKTVEMNISNDVLKSIANINGKELLKNKKEEVSELKKLYYVTNEGCFTYTTGACLNSFTLEKPVKILLNERIVKLFKLFKNDTIKFTLGHDQLINGMLQTKIILETEDTYLAAIITNDDLLLSKINGPYEATKKFISENYNNRLVLSVNELSSAISRLMLFTKNSIEKADMTSIPAKMDITNNDITIVDNQGNSEVITVENGSYVDFDYDMKINLFDIKLILDSCKDEHITLNCGNRKSIVITRGNIYNLIPEGKRE